jgi:hypothetical protein
MPLTFPSDADSMRYVNRRCVAWEDQRKATQPAFNRQVVKRIIGPLGGCFEAVAHSLEILDCSFGREHKIRAGLTDFG